MPYEMVDFYERNFYVLSNFSSFRLIWRGLDFDTSEHAYQWSKRTWRLCALCHGVAHDPDPEGWGEPCDNCAGKGGMWVDQNGEPCSVE